MPLIQHKPNTTPTPKPELPVVASPEFKGVVYQDDQQPLINLVAFAEGAPWTVDYFQQVLGKDNDIREVDVGQSATYQQYNRIKNFEIRVTDPLSHSVNQETSLSKVEGAGNMVSSIIPNPGDHFVAEAGINSPAIFMITTVERKSMKRESVYEVRYVLITYIVQQPGMYQNLKDKTVREYYFDKSRLLENIQPLLKAEDYNNLTSLGSTYFEIVEYYFKTFFNQRFYMLLLPGQESSIFDPFLMNFILKIVDVRDAQEIRSARNVAVGQDVYLTQTQLFEALAKRSFPLLKQCNKRMGLVSRDKFYRSSFFGGFALNKVHYMVYPETVDESTNVAELPKQRELTDTFGIVTTTGANGSIPDIADNTLTEADVVYQYIKPANLDGFYVLSESFYTDGETGELSILEILVRDYLKHAMIDLVKLKGLTDRFLSWRRMDQFYYGPLLLLLILEARRSQYTT